MGNGRPGWAAWAVVVLAGWASARAVDLQLPDAPGDHKLRFTTTVDGRPVRLSYLLHLPPGYDADSPADPLTGHRRPPMLVFLHGKGECGTDLAGIYALGPMTAFRPGDSANPGLAASWPFVALCPQCPPRGETWTDDDMVAATVALTRAVVATARVDPDRVYVTGLSMGGQGTWAVAQAAPDLFAAAAPLSALPWHPELAGDRLRFVPVWAATGLDDEARFVDGGHEMQRALAGSAVPDRFTFVVDGEHGVFNPMYEGPSLYEWLLEHRRPAAADRARLRQHPADPQAVPTAPGHYALTYDVTVGDQPVQLDYVLYVPRTPATGPRPALLFLSESDTVGPDYDGVCVHGPDLALERTPALQATYPFVVVSPRRPAGMRWDHPGMFKALAGLLDHVSAAVPIDPARTSVSGVDVGGWAAWRLATALPDRFAALVWVSTRPDINPPLDGRRLVRALPGRAYVTTANPGLTHRLVASFTQSTQDWKALPLPDATTPLGDLPAYSDPVVIGWLAAQRRPRG